MNLTEFLINTQNEVDTLVEDRIGKSGESFPYKELIFSEIVMQHMFEIGMTFEPTICHYSAQLGNTNLRLSGYAISEDTDQIDLFVSLYGNKINVELISDTETKRAAEQCLHFFAKCVEGKLTTVMDESNDAYILSTTIQSSYRNLEQIRIYVLTDRKANSKNFKSREISGKTIKLEVMDIERLYRHLSEGKPRDEILINFEQVAGSSLPCVYVPGEIVEYDYALTVIPGEVLFYLYEKYGARLLEANVRSFLSITGKVNRNIRDTIQNDPQKFMAFNNGIVIVADEAQFNITTNGSIGLLGLKGMQIVNGGQTTASIYFTKKKYPNTDLSSIKIPVKIIILKLQDAELEQSLISDISKYSNSQNSVKASDLSANKPYHIEIEKLSMTTYCPNGVGRWFYERATGSYNTMLAREGTTPAKLKNLKNVVIPSSRKITKTDLAKYLNAWNQKPDTVSLGSQKNFEHFMNMLSKENENNQIKLPDVLEYKSMIAKTIIYKKLQNLIRPIFPAFQANITTYVVSFLSYMYGDRINLNLIWTNQDISNGLQKQLITWAKEINIVLHDTANGKMLSEWAKKPECWTLVKQHCYSPISEGIAEM